MFLERTLDKHFKWLHFLHTHFDSGMKRKGYDEELKDYWKSGSGLGDWLGFRQVSCVDAIMLFILNSDELSSNVHRKLSTYSVIHGLHTKAFTWPVPGVWHTLLKSLERKVQSLN